jgi:hypothetical protein
MIKKKITNLTGDLVHKMRASNKARSHNQQNWLTALNRSAQKVKRDVEKKPNVKMYVIKEGASMLHKSHMILKITQTLYCTQGYI